MRTVLLVVLVLLLVLISGCTAGQPDGAQPKAKFSCENDNPVSSRGYILLMGLADHHKEGWDVEKSLMEKDPKAKFVLIYDQDETKHLEEISDKFLLDINNILKKNPVDELVLFGASAGGVTASYSISRLNFSGPVGLHTLSSPLKGYYFRGAGEAFLGERSVYERDIALGLEPFGQPGKNVKAYHHKTVTDTILKDYYCGAFAALCDPIKIQNNNLAGSKEFYYPQYDHNSLMGVVIRKVLKCYNPEISEALKEEEIESAEGKALGTLCSGEESCKVFCHTNKGTCTKHCNNNPDNPLCQQSFAYDCVYFSELPFCQKLKADLENKYLSLKTRIESSIKNGPKYTDAELKKILDEINELRMKGLHEAKRIELEEKARSNLYMPPTPTPEPPQPPRPRYPENFFNPDIPCTTNPYVRFTTAVVNPDDLNLIVPMGAITHEEATTHTYLFAKDGKKVTLYVPADSVLTEVSYSGRDYGLTFQASCEFMYTFGHITDPVEKIKKTLESDKAVQREGRQEKYVQTSVEFKAGDLIGQTTGTEQANGFDLGAYHKNQANYFANKARYENSKKFYNAVCPYDYFDNQTRAAYYNKFGSFGGIIPGSTCGSASQDKVGTISGNWHDTQSIEWNLSSKKVVFGVDGESENPAIRIMMSSRPVFFIFSGDPTYKKPKEVTKEHCYEDSKTDTIIYVRLVSDTEMRLYVDDTAKTCPSSFPEDKAVSYFR